MHYATDALSIPVRITTGFMLEKYELTPYFRLSPRDVRKINADTRCVYLASILSKYFYSGAPVPHTIDDVLYSQARILFRWRVGQVVGSRLTDVLCRRAAIRSYKKGLRRAVDRAKAEALGLSNVVTAHGRAA